ncbi:hypothetical protein EVAR_5300_1 [Eumeta japonica]|uniref:Uncharacterized protein n=1 Tax=Eumeta variegata TaxID=151549 RepID=A0A4C1TNY5_EUMVA|nr:hypothetical protein EVAR_5300_1 [Eumeta japonica]
MSHNTVPAACRRTRTSVGPYQYVAGTSRFVCLYLLQGSDDTYCVSNNSFVKFNYQRVVLKSARTRLRVENDVEGGNSSLRRHAGPAETCPRSDPGRRAGYVSALEDATLGRECGRREVNGAATSRCHSPATYGRRPTKKGVPLFNDCHQLADSVELKGGRQSIEDDPRVAWSGEALSKKVVGKVTKNQKTVE